MEDNQFIDIILSNINFESGYGSSKSWLGFFERKNSSLRMPMKRLCIL